jgi:hypothetical protein
MHKPIQPNPTMQPIKIQDALHTDHPSAHIGRPRIWIQRAETHQTKP